MTVMSCTLALATAFTAATTTSVSAQPNCRNTGAFDRWLADFKREAASKGISGNAIAAAAPYLVLDQRIINIDRGQRFFAQTFLEMSDKMLPSGRLSGGAAKIKQHAALFSREEKEFGVPAPVITAWITRSDHWPRSPTTAGARTCSEATCSTRSG
jgi:membrane-bound lytic murein transglycosylase B